MKSENKTHLDIKTKSLKSEQANADMAKKKLDRAQRELDALKQPTGRRNTVLESGRNKSVSMNVSISISG